MFANTADEGTYDVVICGAGLAGLCLARQLRLQWPEIKLLVLAKKKFPLTSVGKVGESTVEIAANYFADTLQLKDYFLENHYRKLGFRLFFGYPDRPLEERPELGLTEFSSYDSFQIDRVVLENDLMTMNREAGIPVEEEVTVKDIEITEGDDLHQITYKLKGEKEPQSVKARWAIDAMGRRRFLQKKLGHAKPSNNGPCSSAWFWVEGRFDVDDWVDPAKTEWHERMPERIRYFSTNHFMYDGYWIWIIPLKSGHTSVGLVTQESRYAFSDYDTRDKMVAWLKEHQPLIAEKLEGRELSNFQKLRNYSYSSERVFSEQRWACVGEAAVFPDPFYSPGSNLVGFENCITTSLIADDLAGHIHPGKVYGLNEFIIAQNDWFIYTIQNAYKYHGRESVMFCNFMWVVLMGWLSATPQMFNKIFLDPSREMAVRETTPRFFQLTQKIMGLFDEWCEKSQGILSFGFIDYLAIPFIKESYDRSMRSNKSLEQILEDSTWGQRTLETFAQVIFLMAVEDCMPEHRGKLSEDAWYNTMAMSLNPENWESEGLFNPETPKGALAELYNQLRPLFHEREVAVG